MTYFLNIYIHIYVDIFIIVFYLPFYCNIRYVVLSFDEIKTHYYYYWMALMAGRFRPCWEKTTWSNRMNFRLTKTPLKIICIKICNLTKQLTFRDASSGFPAKWHLRNKQANSTLTILPYRLVICCLFSNFF